MILFVQQQLRKKAEYLFRKDDTRQETDERRKRIHSRKLLEKEMKEAAKALDFERAAELRDTILELKAER